MSCSLMARILGYESKDGSSSLSNSNCMYEIKWKALQAPSVYKGIIKISFFIINKPFWFRIYTFILWIEVN